MLRIVYVSPGRYRLPMSSLIDGLSMVFGRPFPKPLNLLPSVIWWAVFGLAMLSLVPEAYQQLERMLGSNRAAVSLPSGALIVPIMIALTILQLLHAAAVARRRRLLAPDRQSNTP